jgi:hypothetical protein
MANKKPGTAGVMTYEDLAGGRVVLNVTPSSVDSARQFLMGRLKRLIEESGHSAYEAGNIAGTIADIKSLDQIMATRPDPNMPVAMPISDEEAKRQLKAAERRHNRDEERAIGKELSE